MKQSQSSRDRSLIRDILWGLIIGGTIVILLGGIKYWKISRAIAEASKQAPPPETVTSYTAKSMQWPVVAKAVGTLNPVLGTTLAAETMGKVTSVSFKSGDRVAKGSVLVSLDTSVEEASLRGAQAQVSLADVQLRRVATLERAQANSRSEYDQARASADRAHAEVARLEAEISRRKITAPFDGYAGIRQVNVGQFVIMGAPVVTLQSYSPLYLDFSLPQYLLGAVKVGAPVSFKVADNSVTGESVSRDFNAEVTAIDSAVDVATRQVKVQATFVNDREILRPGMFVEVTLDLLKVDNVVAIPASAVKYGPYGNSVFIVEKGVDAATPLMTVRSQLVQLGRREGDLVAVTNGLDVGTTVVSSGVFKLRHGAAINISDDVNPGASFKPTPDNT